MEDRKLTVRAVERALDILLCFTRSGDLGLTEIASEIGLHKSTVHRLLATLEEKGFVVRNSATDKYRLGIKIWELSTHLSQSDDPATMLLPDMEQLRDRLGETISLYIRDGAERLRIQAVQSNQAIRRVAPVGARLPLTVGASSKVLVAFSSEQEREHILGMSEWPPNVDPDMYRQQLDEVHQSGYSTSYEEREPGAAAVAVPIFDSAGQLRASLSLSGPVSRLSMDKLHEYAPILIEVAHDMGIKLR
ncbi:IclR family transcriptional regulator [Paenibacillus hunanensis]|uniref:DNA-binding IclR family transcriptional regulator n=1 Tax=Paenibacillus hunanensis TaxID=539262 RepID=A0ABU1J2W6_9BACL|nr:IclR family transcriptional regulator [Paenibacillus hunanensis]MDR6245852.1 DNA-binding IclR family transcriptional regulator [Paenibacillus hunanensis]WPP40983.1 IclR family transcriptional regulator [Paenibacillus hunanensis]GGJ13964.1 IclR family transcriptional regulator [Paenibacillus hunanensis]